MLFEYECPEHGVFDKSYRIGQAPSAVCCPECDKPCMRHYGGADFILKGGGWPSRSASLNREMTQRNRKAGQRMRGTWDGTQPKLVDQN